MAYASASDVAAHCQQIINPEDTFSESSCPTSIEVEEWLSSGCSIIETNLVGAGFSTPVLGTSVTYGWIKYLNSIYAAAQAEQSRANVIIGLGERTRAQLLENKFWEGLSKLVGTDLTLAGIEKVSDGKIYAGGISRDTKQTYEDDTDRVSPRFTRGQFEASGTVYADGEVGNNDDIGR